MRKVFFRVLAGVAIFLSSVPSSHAQMSLRVVRIDDEPMSIFYSDKDFWKQNGHSNQADVIEQEAMRLIEDFESIHYDLYLAWLRGEENDNGDIACLEQKLSELYWSLDRVSASAEENPLLQKNDVQD